ncbi:iron chelate uptake ABC transporter family permease subunit, partial [Psychrobacter sp.]
MRSLFLLLILLCAASLMLGSKQVSIVALFNFSSDAWLTLTASRIPRLIALVLTGVGLSVSGVILQHIVRNKFVEPATSGGLDAAKLGILVSLTLLPSASTSYKMLFSMLFCFAASLL